MKGNHFGLFNLIPNHDTSFHTVNQVVVVPN